MNKLGYTEKQVGHMTYRKWSRLWDAYKNNFDNELILKLNRTTYEEASKPTTIDDVIPT